MALVRHPTDGRVHYSEIREMRRSPAHYRHACSPTEARKVTRAMLVGSIGDAIVFDTISRAQTSRIAVFKGKVRNGKEWDAFQGDNYGRLICSASEYDDAFGAASAVLADPAARALLEGCEFQKVAQWTAHGLECAAGIEGERGGFDAIRVASSTGSMGPIRETYPGQIHDLKITASSDPEELSRHAVKMLWHVQGAWYVDGARAMGLDVDEFRIIAVESTPPHCVTVLRVLEKMLDEGRKSIRHWTERLRACDASGEWPGYVQSEVELEAPSWWTGTEEET